MRRFVRVSTFDSLLLLCFSLAASISGFFSSSPSCPRILVSFCFCDVRASKRIDRPALQFVMLKLMQPAIVQTITFGKFEKTCACNLKEFKVYGGAQKENMVELVSAGLNNDSRPETFEVLHAIRGVTFPIQYLKVSMLAGA